MSPLGTPREGDEQKKLQISGALEELNRALRSCRQSASSCDA